MRAAVLDAFEQPLRLADDVPIPTPGHGEILVRTAAAGLCRTDLKVIDGVIPTVTTPRILGHEIAGEVAAVGPGVEEPREGDRVLVVLDVSCGTCRYCQVGRLDHCANLQRLGMEHDGGLAEYVVAPANNAIGVPDEVDLADAAVLPDAVGSPYHAVTTLGAVGPADVVAVYGLGGLGLSAVQVARLCGAHVIAIARTPQRRALAEQLGAAASIDPNDGPVSDQLRDLTDGLGVHAFIDVVGIADSGEQAVLSCRKGGRVIVLGYVEPRLDVPMMRLLYDEITIKGSRGSTREDLHRVVELAARRELSPIIGERIGLDDVNDALARLREGQVIGRAVVTFDRP